MQSTLARVAALVVMAARACQQNAVNHDRPLDVATLTIRNLEDDVVDALKARARRNSRSLEAEVREVLRDVTTGGSPEF